MKERYGRRLRYSVSLVPYSFSRVRYSIKGEYGVNWQFPPETWHEADLSDDKLVYSLGWRVEGGAEIGLVNVSVTARSEVEEWEHWTLTAQTPKVV